MGFYNMQAALRVAPDKLPPGARVTLLAMASMAMDVPSDRQDARLYFGGWQMVCAHMGFLPSDDMQKRFIRDVATLRKCGIVELVEPGRRGQRAIYRLLLPVDNSAISGDND